MFVKNDYKVCDINEFKFPYSLKVRVEHLWVITLEKNILLV